ncbi:hypothetical protein WDV85_09525 [Pseudokineococcus sp. 5B2Z-1]|uniref:hypothetical protein n=1 Tax=Pseudokineococcus sp. 5B2Z-1 TaxID=3132744 RepID=UPI003097CCD8
MALREHPAAPARRIRPWPAVAVTGAASTALGVLALATAPGATTVDGTTYDTTFVTEWLWWLAYALVPVAAALAWRARAGYLAYVATGAALVLPHVVVAAVVVARYRLSGWGDGLEVFAFLHPVGLATVATGGLAVVGAVDALRRRRAGAR